MKCGRHIALLVALLWLLSLKAQYFQEDYGLVNKLLFTESGLEADYRQVKISGFSAGALEKFLTRYLSGVEQLAPADQLNLHLLAALHHTSSSGARQVLYHSRMAETLSEKEQGLHAVDVLQMKMIVYHRLGFYEKSNLAAGEYTAMVAGDPLLLYQAYFIEACNLEQLGRYTDAIAKLENSIPFAGRLSVYDHYKCIEQLVQLADKNEDNGLALSYLLRQDSLIGRLENSSGTYCNRMVYRQKPLGSTEIQLLKVLSSNNIGFMYQKLGDSNSAEVYLLRSIRLLDDRKKKSTLWADIEINTGLTYTHLKRYSEAERHLGAAYDFYKKQGDKRRQCQILNMLAKNSFLAYMPAIATSYCEESLKTSISGSDWENAADSYFILSEVYAYSSDFNNSQFYYKEYTRLRKIVEQKAVKSGTEHENAAKKLAEMETEIAEEIDSAEKRRLEIIRIKLESAQKEQELLLLKKDNELKAQSLINQRLEKAQAEKSLALIREQLEKQQLEQKYNASQKERELKRVENLNYQSQVKLLNSQKALVTKENVLKEQELVNNRRVQFFLYTGISLISLFFLFALYAFFRNRRQTRIIRQNMRELQQLSSELKESNTRLESSVVLLNDQKRIIEEKNEMIIDSIDYSSQIQRSLFITDAQLAEVFASAFVINLPRDIVTGDFYMVRQKGHLSYVAVVDCTGHGVPGSLMSIIGYQEISHLLDSYVLSPSGYLRKLNKSINQLVNSNKDFGSDGMDVMLLEIDGVSGLMRFAGARNYLIVHNSEGIQEHRGDRISIGERPGDEVEFTDRELKLQPDDVLYLFTDGFQDQQKGQTGKRIGSKSFKEFIRQHAHEPLSHQKQAFLDFFQQQKGDARQTDDVTLLAIKPHITIKQKTDVMSENQSFRKLMRHISGIEKMPDNLVVVYGNMNQDIIVSTIRLVERKLILGQYSKSLITRVKILSTEMMQNVKKHQTASNQFPPYFMINFDPEHLVICSGNLIHATGADLLRERLDNYKAMEQEQLKDVYLNTFSSTSLSPEGNAGLGLLTIIYKSNRNVRYDMVRLSQNEYQYNLEVSLRIKEYILNA